MEQNTSNSEVSTAQVSDTDSSDLNTIDLSRPLLAPGKIVFAINRVPNNDWVMPTKSGGRQLRLMLQTINDEKLQDGTLTPPGQNVFHNVNLTPSGGLTTDMIKKQVASLVQGVGGVAGASLQNVDQWAPTLEGKQITAALKVEPEKDGYPAKNTVSYFVVAKKH